MPHSTHRYPFEAKVWRWAQSVNGDQGFFALVGADGTLTVLETRREASSWVFYDPFDFPVYAWLEWTNVSREILEKLLGAGFQSEDLKDFTGAKNLDEIPESWGVMFSSKDSKA